MGRKHPNVLKLQRQKRKGRRAYLTSKFSVMHVPRSISTSHIPEDAEPLFRRRYDVWDDAYLNAIFPGITPQASQWKSEYLTKFTDKDGEPIAENVGEHNGRKFALDRSEEERLLALVADPDVCDYHTMPVGEMTKTRLTFVFNRQKTRCYFLEIAYRDNASYCMKSKVYGSEERAMFDFQHRRISWMEFLELSSLSLVLPRRVNG